MHRRLQGGAIGLHGVGARWRVGAEVTAGDVKRRQCRLRVLRQTAPARRGKGGLRTATLRDAAVP
jgi:hypothetical protein